MRKHILSLLLIYVIAGCAAKTPPPVTTGVPSGGYKNELAELEKQELQRNKPTPSLWADVGSHGTIFLDYKARLVGDVVIVKIVESSSANNSNSTNTGKNVTYGAGVTNLFGLPTNLGMTNFLNQGKDFSPTIEATTANSFQGQGSKQRTDSIKSTIAARVVEVLPSGNLIIEGQREILVDQEKQTITVRGVVRQKDIDATNTVASTSIADAQISYSGDGVISDANRKGWLATVIDWVWPF